MTLPATMRAAVYHRRGELRVEERPLPELGPRDALLEVSHCGVCGTDLHLVLDGWGRPGSIGGHEFTGRIVALGEEIEGFALGELVAGGPSPGCGECEPCRRHRPSLCKRADDPGVGAFQGAFAHYVRVHGPQLLHVPDGLGAREAALAEPLAVALHAITQSGVGPGGRALVAGGGPIGQLILASLRARGVEDVVVSERAAPRRARAEALGAARVLEPEALEAPVMPFQRVPAPYDAVFECSGRAEAMESGLGQLDKMGVLVLIGTGAKRPKLDAQRVLLNELVITGAYNYDENGMRDALALLATGVLPTDLLLHGEDAGLDELLEHMQRLQRGEIETKLLVSPNGERS